MYWESGLFLAHQLLPPWSYPGLLWYLLKSSLCFCPCPSTHLHGVFNMQTRKNLLVYSDSLIALLQTLQGSPSQVKAKILQWPTMPDTLLLPLPLPLWTGLLTTPSLTLLHHTSLLAVPQLLVSSAWTSLPRDICIISSLFVLKLLSNTPISRMLSLITLI